MSDFAKAQLLKYGWTEGKGLGKNENGISEALKPKLKFDKSGVGHKELNFEWWDSIYNKALQNIVLDKKSDEVTIKVVKENAFNISSTKSGLDVPKKTNSLCYGKFLKTSTLKDGNMVKDNTCETMEDETKDDFTIIKLSDEELFKACGGRTGHKGARHGLNLSGKLARIAEQEKQLCSGFTSEYNENLGFKEVKNKRKKKNKNPTIVENSLSVVQEEQISNKDEYGDNDLIIPSSELLGEDYVAPVRTSRKVKRKIHSLTHQLTKSCKIKDDPLENKKIKFSNLSKPLTKFCTIQEDSLENTKKPIANKLNFSKLTDQLTKSCIIQDDSFENSTMVLNDAVEEITKKKHRKRKVKKSKRKLDSSDITIKNTNSLLDSIQEEPCKKKSRRMKMDVLESNSESLDTSTEYDQVNDTLKKLKKDKAHCLSKVHKHNYCKNTVTEAKRLITIQKKKYARKQAKKVEKLSQSFLAVSLDMNTNTETKKKSKKKHKKNKSKQKSFVIND